MFSVNDMHPIDLARQLSMWKDQRCLSTKLYEICSHRELGNHKPEHNAISDDESDGEGALRQALP